KFGSVIAVDNVEFNIREGEIFGFIGPSGSGKTTAMRMLCGILVPSSGSGKVGKFDIISESEKIKTIIGYTAQSFSLYEDLTVEENIEFYSSIYGNKASVIQVSSLLETFRISQYRKTLAANLSGGTKQKLAMICAVSHQPRILFLDEPTAGIDPLSSREIWAMLYEFTKSGISIFVNTHLMNEAEHCNQLSFLYQGKIIAHGSPETLKRDVISEKTLEVRAGVPLIHLIGDFQQMKGVIDVYTSGEFLHITTKNSSIVSEHIDSYAQEKNLKIETAEVLPSLEDVFVNLTRNMDS
ncbi:MAG: ABC transporter ATP-binding protein, partial [Candidatus Theseobacter exili]|nr:ABC transporter ATP-binding protein [Candidatus Theseobacter exili]